MDSVNNAMNVAGEKTLRKVHPRFHESYRAILAAYCSIGKQGRTIRSAVRKAKGTFTGRQPSIDSVEQWSAGGRYVDGSPWAILKWSQIADLVEAGELNVEQIRQGGNIEREVRALVSEAIGDPEFRERLKKKPEVLIGLWDRAKKADMVAPQLQKMIDDAKTQFESSQEKQDTVTELIDTGNAVVVNVHNVSELSDEELDRLTKGEDRPAA